MPTPEDLAAAPEQGEKPWGLPLPYGRQCVSEEDIAAVVEVLRSDWLTTGPVVPKFEAAFAQFCEVKEAVAVSSGTAALHAAMAALGVGAGDEVIVPAMTFAASANCVLYRGARPVFADVDPDTLLLDPKEVELKITPATKAIIAVDYAGQPCDYDALRALTENRGMALVADACHSLGARYHDQPVGSLADLSAFSFHPVKPMTTGEGGMVTTENSEMAAALRSFRNHGITTDHRQREQTGAYAYEMTSLGYNYRLTDFASALGLGQLSRVAEWTRRRQQLAAWYQEALADLPQVQSLKQEPGRVSAWHLFVVQLDPSLPRDEVFAALRAQQIGVNVHYLPVHLHPYYQRNLNTGPGDCPHAEAAYGRLLSLPLFPAMTRADVYRVVEALRGELSGAAPE